MRTIVRSTLQDRWFRMVHDLQTFDRASELGALVAGRRKTLGLRQEDLAELAGVSHRFVQALEAGKDTVRLDKVMDVLGTLGWQLAVGEPRPAAR